jgi:hypothetical protein
MGRSDSGAPDRVSASRLPWRASAFALAVLACGGERPAAAFRVTTAAAGADTRLTLHAAPDYKVNARLAPALELPDGTVLRFDAARTADSAYFAEPAQALLAGRHARVHGTLRASVCRQDELVCRSLTLEL